ncbi:MAG: hypothetical protein Q8P18_16825 [Pseudomonadota bacterium]|nr:hypothetical protein [Pseudomonadota bacterium]
MLSTLLLLCGLAEARVYDIGTKGFGAGLVVGNPSGVSLAWRPDGWSAVQAGVGWNLFRGRLDTSVDYLRTIAVAHPDAPFQVPVYVGLGAKVGMGMLGDGRFAFGGEDPEVALRAPLGASMYFDRAPIELFVQAVPYVQVIPDTRPGIDAGFGVRYYF